MNFALIKIFSPRLRFGAVLACLLGIGSTPIALAQNATPQTAPDITVLKLQPKTISLVEKGRATAQVLHPATPAGEKAAQTIVRAVQQKTGVRLTARVARATDREFSGNVILLGNVTNNPALLLLYARRFTPVDAVCPGPQGLLVQTIFDPFGHGGSAIVVGASENADLQTAAETLRSRIAAMPKSKQQFALDSFFTARYSADLQERFPWLAQPESANRVAEGLEEADQILATGAHQSIARLLSEVALRYQLTGRSSEAQLYAALWEKYDKSAVVDPSTYGGAWGFDSDFPSYEVVSGWDNIEEDAALTDAQRLGVLRAMTRWIREAVQLKASSKPGILAFNHQTFPALGLLRAGLYFTQHYPQYAPGREWLAQADRVFRNQQQFFKANEDCNTYQWLTDGHVMRYAVARPDFTVFENGNAQKIADYALGTMNNLGYQVPYGDTGIWYATFAQIFPLNVVAFVTGNQSAAWQADWQTRLFKRTELYFFQQPRSTPAPGGFDGVRVWPLEPAYVATFPAPNIPPAAQLFDKISFRGALKPDAPYLLLDGLSNGGHGHLDGNSIEQLTQYNRIWLADNDYFKTHVKYHNSLQVLKDGQASALPPYASLHGWGETANFGYSHTRLADYSGADWDRTVLHLKNANAFLVLDKVTARQEGEYQLRLLWHGVGEAALDDDGLLLRQKGPSMRFQIAKGPQLSLVHDDDLGQNWKGYPYAEPVVSSMRATSRVRLKAGEHYVFASILHGSETGNAAPWKLNFTTGYNGVALETGREKWAVQMEEGRLTIQSTPGTTSFSEIAGRPAAQSRFNASGAADKIALAPPPANLADQPSAPAFQSLWSLPTSKTAAPHFTGLAQTRSRPGAPGVLLATTDKGELLAVSPQGKLLWTKTFPAALNGLATGDADGDGADEIALARQDEKVTLLRGDGTELWSAQLQPYRRQTGAVNLVRMGDLNGDGKDEVVAGSQNWQFFTFDGSGQLLWKYETVHPSRSAAIADIDGDGTKEVLAGTHYYNTSVLTSDGKRRWKFWFGPICYDIATGNFDGNKTRGMVFGSGDGKVHVMNFNAAVRFQFDTGDEVRHVATADVNGDGRDEILAASDNGYFYCWDANGKLLWLRHLQTAATALQIVPQPNGAWILIGIGGGAVQALDGTGELKQLSRFDAAVEQLEVIGETCVVALADGTLHGLQTPHP